MILRLLRYARNDAMNHVIARVVAMGIAGETRSNLAIWRRPPPTPSKGGELHHEQGDGDYVQAQFPSFGGAGVVDVTRYMAYIVNYILIRIKKPTSKILLYIRKILQRPLFNFADKKISSTFATLFCKNLIYQMNTLSYKTVSLNADTVQKKWVLIDATNVVLGRMASGIAFVLRGKNKAGFTPHTDCGDNVIVVNAEKVRFTGNKLADKRYVSYTGYPGGQHFISPADLMAKKPTKIVEHAVKGMLPKNRLGAQQFRNLYVYAGAEHPHAAQKPTEIKISDIR
jgi:large subunit ribosomal protein L13